MSGNYIRRENGTHVLLVISRDFLRTGCCHASGDLSRRVVEDRIRPQQTESGLTLALAFPFFATGFLAGFSSASESAAV